MPEAADTSAVPRPLKVLFFANTEWLPLQLPSLRLRPAWGAARIIQGIVKEDHIHVLVAAPPTTAPSEVMRRIKGKPF